MNTEKNFLTWRNLPHWRVPGVIYFVTWRLHRRQSRLQPPERGSVCQFLLHFDTTRYLLGDYVVMDDHVHVLVGPLPEFELDEIVRSWRSFTANRLQRECGRRGEIWQTEPYDRVMRGKKEAAQKRNISETIRFGAGPNWEAMIMVAAVNWIINKKFRCKYLQWKHIKKGTVGAGLRACGETKFHSYL